MANKYGAIKTRGYDSKKEARRGDELRLLERAGKIRDLREQVKFLLIPSMYAAADGTVTASTQEDPISAWSRKKRGMWCVERACSYVADFVYVDAATGQTVVEDTKGVRTPDYIIKRKLMLWIYGIQIKEV